MAEWVSQGQCNLCGETFAKAGMTRHITACRKSHALKKLDGRGKARKTNLFHLMVEGTYAPVFWLHLAVPANAALRDLDQFLRDIWLECCGHLSAFTIEGAQYEMDTGGVDAMWPMIFGRGGIPRSMNVSLGEVLRPRLKFQHEYADSQGRLGIRGRSERQVGSDSGAQRPAAPRVREMWQARHAGMRPVHLRRRGLGVR
jgi:hypothetical protein